LINSLYDNAVLLSTQGTVDIAATVQGRQTAILLVNYNWYQQPIASEMVSISVKNLACQPAAVILTYIDTNNSNAQNLWNSWGQPTYLNSSQLSQMKEASELLPSDVVFSVTGAGAISFDVNMTPYSVGLVQISC
jgi:beta-xylosidase